MSEILLTKKFIFSASHRYYNSKWSPEKNKKVFGKCSNPYGHGHNYMLEVTVSGEPDPETGMVINLSNLKSIVNDILEEFDHKNLNEDTPYFKDRIPTTENIATVLFDLISKQIKDGISLYRIRLWETENLYVEYYGGENVKLTRGSSFSAGHRLYLRDKSPQENRKIFGNCSNLEGHGHNYNLYVTLKGRPDTDTGFLIPLSELDNAINAVISQLDHRFLDYEVPFFKEKTSTGENICIFLNRKFQKILKNFDTLIIYETGNNIFELGGKVQ